MNSTHRLGPHIRLLHTPELHEIPVRTTLVARSCWHIYVLSEPKNDKRNVTVGRSWFAGSAQDMKSVERLRHINLGLRVLLSTRMLLSLSSLSARLAIIVSIWLLGRIGNTMARTLSP